MDTLVDDVPLVMEALGTHGARELVNVNHVFERLETLSATNKKAGSELVNLVVRSFLVDLGIEPGDGADVEIIDNPEDARDRVPAARSPNVVEVEIDAEPGPSADAVLPSASGVWPVAALNVTPDDFELSPGLAGAFNEPFNSQDNGFKSKTGGHQDSVLQKESKSTNGSTSMVPMPSDFYNGAGPSTSKSGAISGTQSLPGVQKNTSPRSMPSTSVNEDWLPDPAGAIAIPFAAPETEKNTVLNTNSSFSPKRTLEEPFFERKKIKTSMGHEPINLSEASARGAPNVQSMGMSNHVDVPGEEVNVGNARLASLGEMFPDADPQYLWDRWRELKDEESFNALIDTMLSSSDYPRVYGANKQHWNGTSEAGSITVSVRSLGSDPSSNSRSASVSLAPSSSKAISATFSASASTSKAPFSASASTSKAPSSASASTSKAPSSASASTLKAPSSASALITKAPSSGASASTSNAAPSSASSLSSTVPPSSTSVSTTKAPMLKKVSSLGEMTRMMDADTKEAAAPASEPWRDQLDTFIQILPDADPSYLEEKARQLFGKEDELRQFVANALEQKDYPSRKDWLWRQEQMALQKKYTEEFSIPNFLEVIPDPFSFFDDVKRQCSNRSQALMFLRNKYRKLRVADINAVFSQNGFNLTRTCKALDVWTGPTLKGIRTHDRTYDLTKNESGKGVDVPFLQEIAFLENKQRIIAYIDDKKTKREERFNEAKIKGELMECQCCYFDEVLLEDIRTCSEGHPFCVTCLQRSSEQRIGDGHTTFPCLAVCTAEFPLATLQEVLKPTVFSRLVQRKQAEEVKAAGIEDLVQCPFCDFCNIPPKEDKIFRCLNPDCMKESCRLCKEESHVPLRCEEVEKKGDVEIRTYIENKMTEALVRTCYKCQKKFVKEDGCNKMTCQCGAMMCYICRQPVKDYSHFNGQGGEAFEKCPLWSNNDELHVAAVAKVAKEARQEVLARDPTARLVHDPTAVLPQAQHARHGHGHGHNHGHRHNHDLHRRIRQHRIHNNRRLQRLLNEAFMGVPDLFGVVPVPAPAPAPLPAPVPAPLPAAVPAPIPEPAQAPAPARVVHVAAAPALRAPAPAPAPAPGPAPALRDPAVPLPLNVNFPGEHDVNFLGPPYFPTLGHGQVRRRLDDRAEPMNVMPFRGGHGDYLNFDMWVPLELPHMRPPHNQ